MAHVTEHNGEGEYEAAAVSIEQSTDAENLPIIGLTGELDLSTIDTLRPVVDAIVAQQPERITFELNGLTFLDSSGIALLAEAAQGGPNGYSRKHLRVNSPSP